MKKLSQITFSSEQLLTEKQQQSIFGGKAYNTCFHGHRDRWWDNDESGTLSPNDLITILWRVVPPDAEQGNTTLLASYSDAAHITNDNPDVLVEEDWTTTEDFPEN